MGQIKHAIRHGIRVPSPEEDSLSPHQTGMLVNAGYNYHGGMWHPPAPQHADTTLAKMQQRRMRQGNA